MVDPRGADGSFRVMRGDRPFARLVALDARWTGNRLGGKFPIDLTLEVDEHHLSIPIKPGLLKRIGLTLSGQQADDAEKEVRLRIRLRHCYVRYESNNVTVIPLSKYESIIQDGKFEISSSDNSSVQRSEGFALGGAVKAGVSASALSGSGTLHADSSLSRKGSVQRGTTAKSETDIHEVQAVPDGWLIGHPTFGDPRNASGCLSGRYFRRPANDFAQTCEAEFIQGKESGELKFIVTVRDGLQVERIDGRHSAKKDEDAAVAAMRDRIAGLALEKHMRPADEALSDDEMPIAAITCEVLRAPEDEFEPVTRHNASKAETIEMPVQRTKTGRRRPPQGKL